MQKTFGIYNVIIYKLFNFVVEIYKLYKICDVCLIF